MRDGLLSFLRGGPPVRANGGRVHFATVGLPTPAPSTRAVPPPVHGVRGLPARLYHGTRVPERLLTEGLRLVPALDVQGTKSGVRYSWDLFRQPAWRWFRRLRPEQRLEVEARVGASILTPEDLGRAVSFLWTVEDARVASSYSDGLSLELDPRRLPLIGYFDDPKEVGGARVLVLPARGFQGGPDAFTAAYKRKPGPIRGDLEFSAANIADLLAQLKNAKPYVP